MTGGRSPSLTGDEKEEENHQTNEVPPFVSQNKHSLSFHEPHWLNQLGTAKKRVPAARDSGPIILG